MLYRAYRTIAELDGRTAHPQWWRWRDMRRDNAAVLNGMSVLRFGGSDIYVSPCHVAGQLATMFRSNGWVEHPIPCGSPCKIADTYRPGQ